MNVCLSRTPSLTAIALITALPATAHAGRYRFEVVADSVQNGFEQGNFTCANINNNGDVAFKGTLNNGFDGIFRRDADGTLFPIAIADGSPFNFFANVISINDSGQVVFGANMPSSDNFVNNAILVGDGGLVTIAQRGDLLSNPFFEFSINVFGEVAFNGRINPPGFPQSPAGLFSGSGGPVTTQYLSSADIILDGEPARFSGDTARPSVNANGDIAFSEFVVAGGIFTPGIFVGQNGSFRTIFSSTVNVGPPSLNDSGTAAFMIFGGGSPLQAIVKSNGGPLTTVADNTGKYVFLGNPSINNNGDVVFSAGLNNKKTFAPPPGIFTGPNPNTDTVIAAGDKLDGATVTEVGLCDDAINDSRQVAFIADLNDPSTLSGSRSVVVRATPIH